MSQKIDSLSDDIVKLNGDVGSMREEIFATNDRITSIKKNATSSGNSLGFLATSYTENSYIPTGAIKFDYVEFGDGFDKYTGVFKAPATGTYIFFFNGFIWPYSNSGEIKVYLNDAEKLHFWNNANYESQAKDRQLSVFWSMSLNRDDEMYLYNPISDSLWNDADNRMYFHGYLAN